jgi:hypothetical protein
MLFAGRNELLDAVIDLAVAEVAQVPDPERFSLLLFGEVGAEPAGFGLGHRVLLASVFRCVQYALNDFECQLHTFALMAKTSAISVRVSDQVKEAAEKAAANDSRSVASYVEKLLAEHLRAKGYLVDQSPPKRGKR